MPKYLRNVPRLTVKAIEEAVRALGYKGVHLYHYGGNYGYYYWSGGVAVHFPEQGVYGSPFLKSMTLKQWVNDFKRRVAESRK